MMQVKHFNFSLSIQNLAIVDIQAAPNEQLDHWRREYPLTNIRYFQIDVTDAHVLRTTFNRIYGNFQSVDVLINAAGIFNDKNLELTFKVNVVISNLHASLCSPA